MRSLKFVLAMVVGVMVLMMTMLVVIMTVLVMTIEMVVQCNNGADSDNGSIKQQKYFSRKYDQTVFRFSCEFKFLPKKQSINKIFLVGCHFDENIFTMH